MRQVRYYMYIVELLSANDVSVVILSNGLLSNFLNL